MFKSIIKIIGILILGALGALLFNLFGLAYFLTSPYFENFQFVKYLKEGKVMVNKTEQVYIQENTATENAIEKLKNSVVTIQGKTVASGLIATSDGNIITLASVIPVSGNVVVFLPFGVAQGQQVSAHAVKIDYKSNLALIKIEKSNLQTVGFADTGKIKLGQRVLLVAPVSLQQDNWFANEGIVREIDVNSIKTNIVEKSTVAGGPLFNPAGELVGLNYIDQEGKISAVSVNKIQELLGL